MIIGFLGDTHITNKKPERRKDDYCEIQFSKLYQAMDTFIVEGCEAVIQVGDLVDSPEVSNRIIAKLILLFRQYTFKHNIKFYSCWGQHDISGHSSKTLPNSPLSILEACGLLTLVHFNNISILGGNINLYGSSFGEEVPDVDNKNNFNILVTHRMIGDRELYPGQELENPKAFLKKYSDFNIIACGDYHYRFLTKYEDRVILNPGALMRKTISKFDLEHEPGVFTVDTNNMEVKFHPINIRSVDEVFDLCKEEKQDNQKLLDFINNLTKKSNSNCNWKSLLCKIINEMDCNENVKLIIDESIEEIIHGGYN